MEFSDVSDRYHVVEGGMDRDTGQVLDNLLKSTSILTKAVQAIIDRLSILEKKVEALYPMVPESPRASTEPR